MALADYAQKRQERVLVRSQASVGLFTLPTARDAVLIRGSAEIPAVMSDFADSEEVRLTRDIDQKLRRKKPPAEFTLTTYAKVPTTKGRNPQWAALARNRFGIEQRVLTVLDFTQLETDNATVTITIDGVPTVLTEDVEWQAGASNSAAATSLAAAIDALAGVSASAVGDEVRITRDQGTGEVVVATSALEADLSINVLRYRFTGETLEKLLTIVHSTHTAADYYRDCIVSKLDVIASGGDEATLVWSGFLGNGVSIGQTRLEGTIAAGGSPEDVKAFAFEDSVVQIGPLATDTVYFQVDAEIFEIITWNPDTKAGTAKCGKLGTTPAGHADAAEVLPYLPVADPEANDQIIGLTLGQSAFDAVARRIVSINLSLDERIIPRIDEAFEATLTGYIAPEARLVGGPIVERQRRGQFEATLYGEREKETVATLRLGTATGPRMLLTMPKARIGRVEKGEADGEFTRTLPLDALASSTPGDDSVALDVIT